MRLGLAPGTLLMSKRAIGSVLQDVCSNSATTAKWCRQQCSIRHCWEGVEARFSRST